MLESFLVKRGERPGGGTESARARDMYHGYTLIYVALQVYISGRLFVLRDASEPRRTLQLSDRAENLEAIELRLKNDILSEAAK